MIGSPAAQQLAYIGYFVPGARHHLVLTPLRDVVVAAQRPLFFGDPDPDRLRRTFGFRCEDADSVLRH